ncbi:MAG TPA: GNAT family N-acetyltransferase [Gaiellaceae bacterium]|nr:GNAT family N-acetyltransferase [Gaiellaceae bacterium]
MTALVEVGPLEWDGLLERLGCADAYLLRGYVESAQILEPGSMVLLHAAGGGGDVVFPLLARDPVAGEARDVTTPYGYGGPVAVGEAPPVEEFWELYGDWCRGHGVVTSFVRFHPLFANQRLAPPAVRLEALAGTVGWRLNLPDLFAGMDGTHRTACRKAAREGVAVAAREAPEDLSAFAALYERTMRRVGAGDFYLFPRAYWEALARLRGRIVVFDAEHGGQVVASALCLATPPWLHYHLGGTGERGRELGASNLLLYEAACWARERGYERFHLGGGAGGRDDSLFSFKRRFDPGGLLECAIGKAVHDPEAYERLAGRPADDLAGFFPAYRERS